MRLLELPSELLALVFTACTIDDDVIGGKLTSDEFNAQFALLNASKRVCRLLYLCCDGILHTKAWFDQDPDHQFYNLLNRFSPTFQSDYPLRLPMKCTMNRFTRSLCYEDGRCGGHPSNSHNGILERLCVSVDVSGDQCVFRHVDMRIRLPDGSYIADCLPMLRADFANDPIQSDDGNPDRDFRCKITGGLVNKLAFIMLGRTYRGGHWLEVDILSEIVTDEVWEWKIGHAIPKIVNADGSPLFVVSTL